MTNIPLNDGLMFECTVNQLERQHIERVHVSVVSSEVEPIAVPRQAHACYDLHLAVKVNKVCDLD